MLGHSGCRTALGVAYREGQPGLAMHRAALFHCLWQVAARAEFILTTGHTATGIQLLTDRGVHGPFDLIIDN